MRYLTRNELLDLHAYALERYGGLLGIKSQDRLQTVVQTPSQQLFGAELYPDLASKAAILVYLLVKSHPFLDANELTALLALLRFLELNGAVLHPEVAEAELTATFLALKHSDLDKESLEQWLRERVVEL
jgi:death-on-curing protein